jgi:ribose-phosphate pyrophosphokinase
MKRPLRPLRLFALEHSRAFGERVGAQLGIELSAMEERQFEDGEHKARSLVDVRGHELCRLLFFIASLKDAGAAHVCAALPYLAYARKDRQTKPRDPVTTRYVATLLEAAGSDLVMTLDVHNLAAFQNAFRCPSVHLSSEPLFVGHLAAQLGAAPVTVVAPDTGAIKRAELFRQALAKALGRTVGTGFVEKYRSGGALSGATVVGQLAGAQVVLFDDLISSGSTLVRAARACSNAGATAVFAAATHGLLAAGAIDRLADPVLSQIAVSDSIAPSDAACTVLGQRLTVLSCAGLFAAAITELYGP